MTIKKTAVRMLPITKKDYEKRNSWGLHAVIDLYGCDPGLIKSFKAIERYSIELTDLIKMKRYGKPQVERFATGYYAGVSLFQFIETSSVTAHFDEQENRAFIDVFSCKYFNAKQAAMFSKKYFKAKDLRLTVLLRN
jgi:S-adenosylmethionine/arginine decarboxylase-like enzyme